MAKIFYYRMLTPYYPFRAEFYDDYKKLVEEGKKVDFYGGIPSYSKMFRKLFFYLLLQTLLIPLFLLFGYISDNKLDFAGAFAFYIAISIFTFFIPFVSFIHMRFNIWEYNRFVKKALLKSKDYKELSIFFDKKYS